MYALNANSSRCLFKSVRASIRRIVPHGLKISPHRLDQFSFPFQSLTRLLWISWQSWPYLPQSAQRAGVPATATGAANLITDVSLRCSQDLDLIRSRTPRERQSKTSTEGNDLLYSANSGLEQSERVSYTCIHLMLWN
jgi:hypothetical protein